MFSTTVDLSPVITTLINIAIPVFVALGTWLGARVMKLLRQKIDLSGTQIDEQLQAQFDNAIRISVSYAANKIKEQAIKFGGSIDVKSQLMAFAIGYVTSRWPEMIKRTGMSEADIAEAIIARFPILTDEAVAIRNASMGISPTPIANPVPAKAVASKK